MNQDMKKGAPSDETIRQANTEIEKIAKSRKLEYIDVYSQYAKKCRFEIDNQNTKIADFSKCPFLKRLKIGYLSVFFNIYRDIPLFSDVTVLFYFA